MQAIQTKYHGATNTRGASISARTDAGRLSTPYDYSIDAEENHRRAALRYATDRQWLVPHTRYTEVQGGRLPDGTYAWILTP